MSNLKLNKRKILSLAGLGIACASLLGCAALMAPPEPTQAEIKALLLASFKDNGQAKLDRLNQSELQEACSTYAQDIAKLPGDLRSKLQDDALNAVKYPADGKYLGDWKEGEKVAQTGVGLQFSDKAGSPAGGNCYACHQLDPKEISYGNIGPSLYNYGKLRGNSEDILKYTWAKVWNSHAYNACSNMPRFGAAGILTEAQLKDVMALLLAPDSPVNK
jgi:L-cysteine S-thiosulfotransferase